MSPQPSTLGFAFAEDDKWSAGYSCARGVCAGAVIAGKYRLRSPLGVGGMGEVWMAENLATGGEVAIKFLLETGDVSSQGAARFRREALAMAQLSHRCIVRVFDLLELPGTDAAAIVMERLRGVTLAERLEREGPLGEDAALALIVPLLSALHYAHGVGIIHRDLKPENVFLHLEPDGELVPKLIDFGVSYVARDSAPRLTLAGEVMGTPSHMSPEQARGDQVSARSDVFCAGVLFYGCVTGRSPFACDDPRASMARVFGAPPSRPAGVTSAIWRVIARALERDPEARYASAAELAEALCRASGRSLRKTLRSPYRPELPTPRPSRRTIRAPWVAAAFVACVAGATVGSSCRPMEARASGEEARTHGTLKARPHYEARFLVSGLDVLVPPASSRLRLGATRSAGARGARRDPYLIRQPGF